MSRHRFLVATVFGCAATVLVGCGDSASPPTPTTTALSVNGHELAKDVPSGFDPCTAVPEQIWTEERLGRKSPDITEAPSGVKWQGCKWVYLGSGYSFSLRMTNLTVPVLRDRHFADATEFQVSGREAFQTHQLEGATSQDACDVNVSVRGGSAEFTVVNPPSRKDTGGYDACQIAKSLAEKIVPSIPASL